MTTPDQSDLSDSLRVVCDTNVLISAVLFPASLPGKAFAHASRYGRLIVTSDLAHELRDVLSRPKFARYVPAAIRDEFLATYLTDAEFVAVTERITICRDPKDDHVLDAAINGRATCILSGDSDLLVLTPFRNIPILNPADFLARFNVAP